MKTRHILTWAVAIIFLPKFVFANESHHHHDHKVLANSENKEISNNMPQMSFSSLFTYTSGKHGNETGAHYSNGFSLQEAELSIAAQLEDMWRGELLIATHSENGEYSVEPEQVFAETSGYGDFKVKVGKAFVLWGKHNQLETHEFPFIDSSLSREILFGHEGLNETGLALSYNLPLPWTSEFTLHAFEGENENVFGSGTKDDIGSVAYLSNHWSINSEMDFELLLAYGTGTNRNKERNHIYNATTFFSWKRSAESKLQWTLEVSSAEKLAYEGISLGRTIVTSTWIEYQASKPWWIKLRYENIDADLLDDNQIKYSALLSFWHSENSATRLQYDHIDLEENEDADQRLIVQLNISFGAHGSH